MLYFAEDLEKIPASQKVLEHLSSVVDQKSTWHPLLLSTAASQTTDARALVSREGVPYAVVWYAALRTGSHLGSLRLEPHARCSAPVAQVVRPTGSCHGLLWRVASHVGHDEGDLLQRHDDDDDDRGEKAPDLQRHHPTAELRLRHDVQQGHGARDHADEEEDADDAADVGDKFGFAEHLRKGKVKRSR